MCLFKHYWKLTFYTWTFVVKLILLLLVLLGVHSLLQNVLHAPFFIDKTLHLFCDTSLEYLASKIFSSTAFASSRLVTFIFRLSDVSRFHCALSSGVQKKNDCMFLTVLNFPILLKTKFLYQKPLLFLFPYLLVQISTLKMFVI